MRHIDGIKYLWYQSDVMHYFVYKNGKGNSWSELAARHGHLFVGFENECQKYLASGKPLSLGCFSERLEGIDSDLPHILVAAAEKNRDRFLLLTFEKTELCFWQITGPVSLHEPESAVWSLAKPLIENVPKAFWPGQEYFAKGLPFRTLAVKRVAQVPRSSLYTSIDSLSVYQYLNRGTCRPLWRISGPTDAEPSTCIKTDPPTDVYQGGTLCEETPFAAFARLYLNDVLARAAGDNALVGKLPGLRNIDDLDYELLMINTMNPILVETAAIAFVQDLGLTPDIGVGKGMDVIDIRARAARPDGSRDPQLAQAALELLKQIGVQTTRALETELLDGGVLNIQCKADDAVGVPDQILYFGSIEAKRAKKRPTLAVRTLPDVLKLPPFNASTSALRRFVALQCKLLRGEWRSH